MSDSTAERRATLAAEGLRCLDRIRAMYVDQDTTTVITDAHGRTADVHATIKGNVGIKWDDVDWAHYLTPDAARALAAKLVERADAAERYAS